VFVSKFCSVRFEVLYSVTILTGSALASDPTTI